MPVFGSPFSGLANDRKLTNAELIRAIRFAVAAESDLTQMYMQLAESTPSKLAVEVLEEIADEERVHVGELLRLLRELAPDEEKLYAEGAKEVEEKIKKKKYAISGKTATEVRDPAGDILTPAGGSPAGRGGPGLGKRERVRGLWTGHITFLRGTARGQAGR